MKDAHNNIQTHSQALDDALQFQCLAPQDQIGAVCAGWSHHLRPSVSQHVSYRQRKSDKKKMGICKMSDKNNRITCCAEHSESYISA